MRLKSEAVRDEIDTLVTKKIEIEHQIDDAVGKLNEAIKEEMHNEGIHQTTGQRAGLKDEAQVVPHQRLPE